MKSVGNCRSSYWQVRERKELILSSFPNSIFYIDEIKLFLFNLFSTLLAFTIATIITKHYIEHRISFKYSRRMLDIFNPLNSPTTFTYSVILFEIAVVGYKFDKLSIQGSYSDLRRNQFNGDRTALKIISSHKYVSYAFLFVSSLHKTP
jgi:hypothetical protein